MKNKKAEQDTARMAHRKSLRNKRKTEPKLKRDRAKMNVKPTILIVCEGKNTEPSYLNQFRLSSVTIKGEGYNTISLVKRAEKLAEKKFDQIWCVFDADPKLDNPKQKDNFNNAIKLAKKNNFGIAYSNQAFEYWIILHFNDHQGAAMNRSQYNDKINDHLKPFGLFYDGNDGCKLITAEIFEILNSVDQHTGKERIHLAISRAKRNYNFFDHKNPYGEESTTTVFRLVEELLKYV